MTRSLRRETQSVSDLLDRGERLMGFGHRVYRAEDPRARVLATNVEFWSAVVLDFAEVPPALFTPMFTCARTAGWSAHHHGAEARGQADPPDRQVRRPGTAAALRAPGVGAERAPAAEPSRASLSCRVGGRGNAYWYQSEPHQPFGILPVEQRIPRSE